MKNLEAADLSTVYAFPVIGDNFEGSRSHVVIRIFYFSSKKHAKKTPKIKEVYTGSHAGCRQEWVPEGTKSQICIRIIYFLHAFWALTPRPGRPTRFPVSYRQHPHVKDHTELGGPNSLKLIILESSGG